MDTSGEAITAEVVTAPGGRVPDFFIVGHPKCGTTALYRMLRRHPQIHMPVKGPRFFSPELRPRFPPATQPDTLEGYMSLFARARPEQLVGEATQAYLVAHGAAARIAGVQPAARIIAILREPASFLRSLHLQSVQNRVETEHDLGKALSLEPARRQGKAIPRGCARPQDLFYSDYLEYVEQLRRYHAVFPREQVLVLIYDDFRRDNEATVHRVLRFLDVDDTAPIEVLDANPTVRVRFKRLHAVVQAAYLPRGARSQAFKSAVRTYVPRQVRSRAVDVQRRIVYGAPALADEKLMLELRRRFKPEVVALSEYLQRDLVSLWRYQDVD